MRFDYLSWNSDLLSKFTYKITEKNRDSKIKNVICNSANVGLIPQIDYFDKAIANNENIDGYYIIRKNDFVYNPRKSSNAPYGPINIYTYDTVGVVSPLYLCFKVKGINKKYLYYYFRGNSWHRYMYMNGDSGARSDRVSIKDDVFFNMPISFPDNTTQEKIAHFLTLIDRRIETQIKIIDSYKLLINVIRDKLIYPSGLKERKLKSFIKIYNGYAFKSDSYIDNGSFKIVTIGNVTGERYINKNNLNTINDIPEDIQTHQVLHKGSILVSLTGNVGRVSICDIDTCLLNQRVALVCPINVNEKYIYHILSSTKFRNHMISLSQGAAQKNIGITDILNYTVPVSSSDEIEKIVNILENIEEKICIEMKILIYLQYIKSYLLKNMFV